MATRPSPRSRTGAGAGTSASRRPARAASSSSSALPVVLGGAGLLVVVVVLVMMNSRGGDQPAATGAAAPAAATPAAGAAKAAPVQLAGAKAGKTPSRPAPPLTQEMLDRVRSLTATASALYNEGVTARTAGDNTTARDKQAKAKETLDQLQTMLAAPLLWQEEAQMEDWAQSAEYITLEREYGKAMSLTKKIRMGGGK